MISRVKSGFDVDTSNIEKHITSLGKFYQEKYEGFLNGKDIHKYTYEEIIARDGNSITSFSNYDKWFTKEALLYREIFEKYYPHQVHMIKDYWMPNKKWPGCAVDDPSARVLSNYGDSGK